MAECKSHENLLLQQLHDVRAALATTRLTEAEMYIGHVRNSVDHRLAIEDEIKRYLASTHMLSSTNASSMSRIHLTYPTISDAFFLEASN